MAHAHGSEPRRRRPLGWFAASVLLATLIVPRAWGAPGDTFARTPPYTIAQTYDTGDSQPPATCTARARASADKNTGFLSVLGSASGGTSGLPYSCGTSAWARVRYDSFEVVGPGRFLVTADLDLTDFEASASGGNQLPNFYAYLQTGPDNAPACGNGIPCQGCPQTCTNAVNVYPTSAGQIRLATMVDLPAGTWLLYALAQIAGPTMLTKGGSQYIRVSGVVRSMRVTQLALPSSPPGLSASAGPNPGEIELAIRYPSNDQGSTVTSYRIYRGTSAGGETYLGQVDFCAPGSLCPRTQLYRDTGLLDGTTYYYKVGAVNAGGESARSSEVAVTTFAAPAAPQNLIAVVSGPGQIMLRWQPPATDGGTAITRYRIYRSYASGAETLLGQSTATSYTDQACTALKTCYYVVKAVNVVGEGPASNEAAMITAAA